MFLFVLRFEVISIWDISQNKLKGKI